MSRLTKKYDGKQYLYALFSEQKLANKLGQLEDIEDELGIDLVVFLKVCIEEVPVYSKDSSYPLFPYEFDKTGFTAAYEDEYDAKSFLWKYYGKTWALDRNDLTREELL